MSFQDISDVGVAASEANHFERFDIEQRRGRAIEMKRLQPVIDDDIGDRDDRRLDVLDPEFGAAERKIG